MKRNLVIRFKELDSHQEVTVAGDSDFSHSEILEITMSLWIKVAEMYINEHDDSCDCDEFPLYKGIYEKVKQQLAITEASCSIINRKDVL